MTGTVHSTATAGLASPVPLWRNLSRGEHYRYLSRFMHLGPAVMLSLDVTEFALLIQWIFQQRGLETTDVIEKDGKLDLVLASEKYGREEFARVHYRKCGIPVSALYDVLKELKGTHFKRIHLCTVDTFTEAQKRAQSEFPLMLKMVEGEDLKRYLCEVQQLYRTRLARRSDAWRLGNARLEHRTLWSLIKQRLLDWLRGSS